MPEQTSIHEIQAAITTAEHALVRYGRDLQFLVTPQGKLEIARRSKDGEPVTPKDVIAELEGVDLMLWRADPI